MQQIVVLQIKNDLLTFRFWNIGSPWWCDRIQGRYLATYQRLDWLENVYIDVSIFLRILYLLSYNTQAHSWSIGGDPDAQTVATFLRFYTPNIVGASLGNTTYEVILICS